MTRERMNVELSRVQRETGKTVLLFTPSIPEAVVLADRVLVMTERPGAIAAIYDVPLPRPRSLEIMGDPLFTELVQFVSGEDLTCQAGLAVQQDLALGALIGIAHAERNGHHYVDGLAGAPRDEAEAFRHGHPDLYHDDGGAIRLAIHDGDLLTGSLTAKGFATSVHPDWSALAPLRCAKSKTPQEQTI